MPIIEPEFMDLTRDLDPESFWEENSPLWADPTRPAQPKQRAHLCRFGSDDHWLFEFLGVRTTNRYYQDKGYRDALHREANVHLWEHLRLRWYDEDSWQHQPKRIENLFGCEFAYHDGGTPWFMPVTYDPAEFGRILDRAEATDVATWAFPEPFLAEWAERKAAGKPLPHLGTGARGPATVMTSVLSAETCLLWCIDEPELMARFRDVLTSGYLSLSRALRSFSGHDDRGWWITDDNCCLFNPRQYRTYCQPVLRAVLDEFAPAGACRYQHSDSAMAHQLDAQRELGINSVNYGPEIDVGLIRAKLPEAVINGHLPPFLLRNGAPDEIRHRIREDFAKVGAGGKLNIATAGSIPAGTGLGRLRWLMRCVQSETRYR